MSDLVKKIANPRRSAISTLLNPKGEFNNNYKSSAISNLNVYNDKIEDIKVDKFGVRDKAPAVVRVFETIGDIGVNFATGAMKGVEGIVDLGAGLVGAVGGLFDSDFQDDVKNFIATDHVGNVMNPILSSFEDSYLNDWGEVGTFVRNVASGVGQMLPSIAVTVATGGAGAASMLTLGASAAGNSTEEAFQDPNTNYYRGLGYGIAKGAVEVATEKMFGTSLTKNIVGKGFLDGMTKEVAKSGIKKIGKEMIEEGLEEATSEFFSPLLENIYKDKPFFEGFLTEEHLNDIGESAVVGGATSLAYGATLGQIGKTRVNVQENLARLDVLDKKEADLFIKGELSKNGNEAKLKNLRDNIKSELSKIVKKSGNSKKTSALINKYNLGSILDGDGNVRETNEFIGEKNKYVSLGLNGKINEISDSLKEVDNKIYSGELTEAEESNYTSFKYYFTLLSNMGLVRSEFVIADGNNQYNSFLDGNVIVMEKKAFESDKWQEDLMHEINHFAEGSSRHQKFTEYVINKTNWLDSSVHHNIQKKYNIPKADVDSFLTNYKNGNLNEKQKLYLNELIAYNVQDYLGNENSLKRITKNNSTILRRLGNSITNFVSLIRDQNRVNKGQSVKTQNKREKLFRDALKEAGSDFIAGQNSTNHIVDEEEQILYNNDGKKYSLEDGEGSFNNTKVDGDLYDYYIDLKGKCFPWYNSNLRANKWANLEEAKINKYNIMPMNDVNFLIEYDERSEFKYKIIGPISYEETKKYEDQINSGWISYEVPREINKIYSLKDSIDNNFNVGENDDYRNAEKQRSIGEVQKTLPRQGLLSGRNEYDMAKSKNGRRFGENNESNKLLPRRNSSEGDGRSNLGESSKVTQSIGYGNSLSENIDGVFNRIGSVNSSRWIANDTQLPSNKESGSQISKLVKRGNSKGELKESNGRNSDREGPRDLRQLEEVDEISKINDNLETDVFGRGRGENNVRQEKSKEGRRVYSQSLRDLRNSPVTGKEYSKEEYKNFGWALYNEIITKNSFEEFYKKFKELPKEVRENKSKTSEYMIAVTDERSEFEKDKIIFARGSFQNIIITRVVEIFGATQENIDSLRGEIYDRGRSINVFHDSGAYDARFMEEGLFREYRAKDCINFERYKENSQSQIVKRDNESSRGRDGGRGVVSETRSLPSGEESQGAKQSESQEVNYRNDLSLENYVFSGVDSRIRYSLKYDNQLLISKTNEIKRLIKPCLDFIDVEPQGKIIKKRKTPSSLDGIKDKNPLKKKKNSLINHTFPTMGEDSGVADRKARDWASKNEDNKSTIYTIIKYGSKDYLIRNRNLNNEDESYIIIRDVNHNEYEVLKALIQDKISKSSNMYSYIYKPMSNWEIENEYLRMESLRNKNKEKIIKLYGEDYYNSVLQSINLGFFDKKFPEQKIGGNITEAYGLASGDVNDFNIGTLWLISYNDKNYLIEVVYEGRGKNTFDIVREVFQYENEIISDHLENNNHQTIFKEFPIPKQLISQFELNKNLGEKDESIWHDTADYKEYRVDREDKGNLQGEEISNAHTGLFVGQNRQRRLSESANRDVGKEWKSRSDTSVIYSHTARDVGDERRRYSLKDVGALENRRLLKSSEFPTFKNYRSIYGHTNENSTTSRLAERTLGERGVSRNGRRSDQESIRNLRQQSDNGRSFEFNKSGSEFNRGVPRNLQGEGNFKTDSNNLPLWLRNGEEESRFAFQETHRNASQSQGDVQVRNSSGVFGTGTDNDRILDFEQDSRLGNRISSDGVQFNKTKPYNGVLQLDEESRPESWRYKFENFFGRNYEQSLRDLRNSPVTGKEYSKEEYKNFGWALYNEIITKNSFEEFYKKFKELPKEVRENKSKTSEYMFAVTDERSKFKNDKIIFAKGSFQNIIITRVVEIFGETQENIDSLRGEIYVRARGESGFYDSGTNDARFMEEGLFREYRAKDCVNFERYRENSKSRTFERDNESSRERDGGRGVVSETRSLPSGEESQGAKQSEGQEVNLKKSAFIPRVQDEMGELSLRNYTISESERRTLGYNQFAKYSRSNDASRNRNSENQRKTRRQFSIKDNGEIEFEKDNAFFAYFELFSNYIKADKFSRDYIEKCNLKDGEQRVFFNENIPFIVERKGDSGDDYIGSFITIEAYSKLNDKMNRGEKHLMKLGTQKSFIKELDVCYNELLYRDGILDMSKPYKKPNFVTGFKDFTPSSEKKVKTLWGEGFILKDEDLKPYTLIDFKNFEDIAAFYFILENMMYRMYEVKTDSKYRADQVNLLFELFRKQNNNMFLVDEHIDKTLSWFNYDQSNLFGKKSLLFESFIKDLGYNGIILPDGEEKVGVVYDISNKNNHLNFKKEEAMMRVEASKEIFGVTDNPAKAGILTTDGHFLDFNRDSENLRKDDFELDFQTHYDLDALYGPEMQNTYNGVDYFLAEGNIRLAPEMCLIDLVTMPNEVQFEKLTKYLEMCFLSSEGGVVYVSLKSPNMFDFKNGFMIHYDKTKFEPEDVIKDIKSFYRTGKVSRVIDHHKYSKKDLDSIGSTEDWTTENGILTEKENRSVKLSYVTTKNRNNLNEDFIAVVSKNKVVYLKERKNKIYISKVLYFDFYDDDEEKESAIKDFYALQKRKDLKSFEIYEILENRYNNLTLQEFLPSEGNGNSLVFDKYFNLA